jgi:hypothetical protein
VPGLAPCDRTSTTFQTRFERRDLILAAGGNGITYASALDTRRSARVRPVAGLTGFQVKLLQIEPVAQAIHAVDFGLDDGGVAVLDIQKAREQLLTFGG